MFENLKTQEGIETEADILGGGGPLPTDIYEFTVDMAYVQKAKSGALGVVLHLKTDAGREHRQTLYVTSGDAKGNKNYYETQKGEKRYLPGFNLFNSLCLLTEGVEAAQVTTEEKMVNVYSSELKTEVPTKVDVFTALLGKRIYGALFNQLEDKNVQNEAGDYVPSGETRAVNELDKFFRIEDKLTTAEIIGHKTEATFFYAWQDKWQGEVRDRTTKQIPANGAAGAPGSAVPAGAQAAPRQSLFSKAAS